MSNRNKQQPPFASLTQCAPPTASVATPAVAPDHRRKAAPSPGLSTCILTDKEKQTIIETFLYARESATKEEIQQVVTWAENTRIQNLLLDNILMDLAFPVLTENGEIAFKLTPLGEEQARNMMPKRAVASAASVAGSD